jgi:signal transduction histidine kinase
MRLPYLRDALSPALDRGHTVTVADVRTDTRLSPQAQQILAQQRVHAIAMIPLMVRTRRIGMVTLSYPEVHTWTSADLQPYQATAAQLATAIDSRLQHVVLTERSQQLAVLDERRRLARELHDSVTQSLFGMSLLAQVLPELWQIDRDDALHSLGQIRDQTRGALAEMRALLFELRPAEGDNQPLAWAIEHHAAAWTERTGIAATVDATTQQIVPPDVSHALMRITQEALHNVAKHAHAQHVQITLHGSTPLRLEIADDGQGFVSDEVGGNHFGLLTMRERAAKIDAHFDVQTAPGNGTTITVEWSGKQ